MTSVHVLVADELAGFVDAPARRELEHRIADDISELKARLGLVGEATAQVRSGDAGRAVQIAVDGAALPYRPSLLRAVWHTAAPYALHGAALESHATTNGFDDGWVRGLSTRPDAGEFGDVFDRFLADLVCAAIRQRPSCLLPDQRIASLASAFALRRSSSRAVAVDFRGLARFLVSAGVSLAERDRVLTAIDESLLVELPPRDRWEVVFEQLRAPRVAIRVHPRYLAALGAGRRRSISVYDDALSDSYHAAFRTLERETLRQRGLRLPPLVWVADGTFARDVVEVVINDLPSWPVRIPEPDQMLAAVAAASLPAPFTGQETYLPASGAPAAVVPASDVPELEARNLPVQSWTWKVADVVAEDVLRRSSALLSVADVTHQLSALSVGFPNLVTATLQAFSLGDVTRVLRGLLDEGLSIRDLRFLLDRLLDFEAIVVRDPTEIVLDRRIATTQAQAEDPDVGTFLAFVRAGLVDEFASRYADEQGRLAAFVVETRLDRHATEIGVEQNGRGLEAEIAQKVRDAVWSKLLTNGSKRPSVVLASTYSRRVLRDALAPELPELGVLAYPELKPRLNVKRIATIDVDV